MDSERSFNKHVYTEGDVWPCIPRVFQPNGGSDSSGLRAPLRICTQINTSTHARTHTHIDFGSARTGICSRNVHKSNPHVIVTDKGSGKELGVFYSL